MTVVTGGNGAGQVKVTCHVGGTFTDVVVSDADGNVQIGKSLTTPHELISGLLSALRRAAEPLNLDLGTLLGRTALFVYSTTQATNAILQSRTARTALLCTEGFPDILVRREGGSMHPYDFSRPYPDPYIPRHLTFEIRERIGADGEIVLPLDDGQARDVIERLARLRIEAVAVALLWSVANGEHENRLAELCAQLLPGVPVTLSHALNPVMREYRRASCAAIDASLKPLMQSHLGAIEAGLRAAGLNGQLVAATSMGGVLPIEHLAQRPIYAAKSGPSLAPVAARLYAEAELSASDAVVCDTGGTSFDVSLVRDRAPVFTRETWLGEPFTGHHTGLASVDVRSIGAGGGSIAWIDSGGLLRVGPDSAGADPGPACYGAGGVAATVTDAACVLGYAVLANRFDVIVREMTNTLFRTGRSAVLNMARDFSCCLVTADNQLLTAAEGLQAHVLGAGLQTSSMQRLHPDISPGDAFLHNDPLSGNTHPADHTLLVPVFIEGRHVCTASAKAHQADCGNAEPTTYMSYARDVYQEGALIFPCARIQRDYADIQDVVRMCRARIRVPEWCGDRSRWQREPNAGDRRRRARSG